MVFIHFFSRLHLPRCRGDDRMHEKNGISSNGEKEMWQNYKYDGVAMQQHFQSFSSVMKLKRQQQ